MRTTQNSLTQSERAEQLEALELVRRLLADQRWFLDSTGAFSCRECTSKFASEAAVMSHLRMSHPPGMTLPCTQCSMVFKDNWHLKRHMFTHGMSDPESPMPKNMCNICNATYPDSWHLENHMKQHENGEVRTPWRWKKRGRPPNSLRLSTLAHRQNDEWSNDPTPPRPPSSPEQFLDNYRRVSGLKPEAMEFYCGICGEGVAKNKFSTHSLGHFHDVFEVRKVMSPGEEPMYEGTAVGDCGECQGAFRRTRRLREAMQDSVPESREEIY